MLKMPGRDLAILPFFPAVKFTQELQLWDHGAWEVPIVMCTTVQSRLGSDFGMIETKLRLSSPGRKHSKEPTCSHRWVGSWSWSRHFLLQCLSELREEIFSRIVNVVPCHSLLRDITVISRTGFDAQLLAPTGALFVMLCYYCKSG